MAKAIVRIKTGVGKFKREAIRSRCARKLAALPEHRSTGRVMGRIVLVGDRIRPFNGVPSVYRNVGGTEQKFCPGLNHFDDVGGRSLCSWSGEESQNEKKRGEKAIFQN